MVVTGISLAQNYNKIPNFVELNYPYNFAQYATNFTPYQKSPVIPSVPAVNMSYPAFQGASAKMTVLNGDAVGIVGKKEKTSVGAKWLIGLGAAAIIGLGARFGYKKILSNIYTKKLKISDLPEKIIFNKATTKEEALKYTKETLKINDISDDCSLEVLNYINKGITDINNFNKGKFINILGIKPMDKDIVNRAKGTVAGVYVSPAISKSFAKLEFNPNYFNHENLDKLLKDFYYKQGNARFNDDKIRKFGNVYVKFDDKYKDLLKKYYTNSSALSFEEKLKLIESYKYLENNINNLNKGLKTGANGIKADNALIAELQSEYHTIYHEFGHLQDLFKNGMKQNIKNPFMYEINIRRNNFNILPTKQHKEFVNTKSIQETVGKISDYAQTSRDEFIAETYARLIESEKLPDDVLALYKKYNGPLPKEFV